MYTMKGNNNYSFTDHETTDIPPQEGVEEVDIGFKDINSNGPANMYVGKRNFIHQLMDVALLMANTSQLKALLSLDTSDKYFYPLLVFILTSITLQVVFTICMLMIWSIEKKLEEHANEIPPKDYPKDHRRNTIADKLDKAGNILVLLIIVSNVLITGFGVESHGSGGHGNGSAT